MENQGSRLEVQLLSQRQQELLASIRKTNTNPSLHRSAGNLKSCSKSQNLTRFYEEATHKSARKQEAVERDVHKIKELSNKKKIQKNSTMILEQKLERTLNENIESIDTEGTGYMNFQQLGRLLTTLGIFQSLAYGPDLELEDMKMDVANQAEMRLHELAWRVLMNDEEVEVVKVPRVFGLLRIVLDPQIIPVERQVLIIQDYFNRIDIDRTCPESLLPIIHAFCVDFREQQRLRLAKQQIGYMKPKFIQELIQDKQKTMTFKPAINEISVALQGTDHSAVLKPSQRHLVETYAKSNNSSQVLGTDASRIEQLLMRHERTILKLEQKQLEREEQEMQECSFKPQINPNSASLNVSKPTIERLYQFKSRQQLNEVEQEAKMQRELDAMVECTFQPQLISAQAPPQPRDVRSFDETVQRMRKAIDLANMQKMKITSVPRGENYNHARHLPETPPSMLQRIKPKKEAPALQIRVNMGPGKIGQLSLRVGENPVVAVRNFVKIWGVGKDLAEDLMARVNEEMDKLQQESQFA